MESEPALPAPPAVMTRAGVVAPAAVGVVVGLVATIAGGVALAGPAVLDGAVDQQLGFGLVLALSFAAAGYLVARNAPGNRLAMVMTGIAWGFALSLVLERHATLGSMRGWAGVTWTLWLAQWIWMPAILAIPTLLPLRFPDGQLPSSRWRPLEVVALTAIGLATAGIALTPYGVVDLPPMAGLENPVGFPFGAIVHRVGLAVTGLAAGGCLGSFVLRLVRSTPGQRAQLLWPVGGLVGAMLLVAIALAAGPQWAPMTLGAAALLPATVAVAILRHGLWDVRTVVNRSLVYGTLTLAVLAIYVVTVALLGGVLGRTFGAPLVATGIVAVGIDPLRRTVQRLSNRLVYGEREDPYAVLSRLGRHLDTAGDRATLLTDAAATVVRALRLRSAAVVVEDRVLASVGDADPRDLQLPLRIGGEPVGALRIGLRPGAELSGKDRRLLLDLARHVSAAVHAERLRTELEESRARLVTAREEERRRIRRDLHDGLGPTLAAIGLEVERVGVDLAADTPVPADRLDDLAARLRSTVRGVRTLVEGLRPAALDELGLVGALEQLVRELGAGPTKVRLQIDGDLADLPAAVDLAAFRIVSEAVTNVVRHAAAPNCLVVIRQRPGQVAITVRDDGRGVQEDAPAGLGRRSMAERAHELGGTFFLGPAAPRGSELRAVLPVAAP